MLATRDPSFAVLSHLARLSLSEKGIEYEGTFRRDISIVPQSLRADFWHCQYIGLKLVYPPQQPLSHFTFPGAAFPTIGEEREKAFSSDAKFSSAFGTSFCIWLFARDDYITSVLQLVPSSSISSHWAK